GWARGRSLRIPRASCWCARASWMATARPRPRARRARRKPRARGSARGVCEEVPRTVKELVTYLAQALVDHPDEVRVSQVEGEKSIILELRVAPPDMGRVIGRQGRVAKALRAVVKAAAPRGDKVVHLEIVGRRTPLSGEAVDGGVGDDRESDRAARGPRRGAGLPADGVPRPVFRSGARLPVPRGGAVRAPGQPGEGPRPRTLPAEAGGDRHPGRGRALAGGGGAGAQGGGRPAAAGKVLRL